MLLNCCICIIRGSSDTFLFHFKLTFVFFCSYSLDVYKQNPTCFISVSLHLAKTAAWISSLLVMINSVCCLNLPFFPNQVDKFSVYSLK